MPHDANERLRLTEAAALYGRHPETLRRWISQKRLQGELVGGIWYVQRREVEQVAGPTLRAHFEQLQQEIRRLEGDLAEAQTTLAAQAQQLQVITRYLRESGLPLATTTPRRIRRTRPHPPAALMKKGTALHWLEEHGIPPETSRHWKLPKEPDGSFEKRHILEWALQHLDDIGFRRRKLQLIRCYDPLDVCVQLLPLPEP
ncbi:MAG: helix-turn-helix domain-containing protein [Ktedonobacterales bacterium]|nr:helix-turn-helix domain-containing protein [Ktedonobacterales bacterium]